MLQLWERIALGFGIESDESMLAKFLFNWTLSSLKSRSDSLT